MQYSLLKLMAKIGYTTAEFDEAINVNYSSKLLQPAAIEFILFTWFGYINIFTFLSLMNQYFHCESLWQQT